jgi:hypothetical protein
MDNYLFSRENIVYLVKNFFTLLNIQIEQTPKFNVFANECKEIIVNCLKQVYLKYGNKLSQTQESVNKINKKCLSNSIQIIKNKLNQPKQQTFKNPNKIVNNSSEKYDVQQHNHPSYNENTQNFMGANNNSGGNYSPLVPTSQIANGMYQNAMGQLVSMNETPQMNNDNNGRKNYAGDLQMKRDLLEKDMNSFLKSNSQEPDPNALSFLNNLGQGQINMAQPMQNNFNQPQNNFNQPQNNFNQPQNNFNQPQNNQPQNNFNQQQNNQQSQQFQTYTDTQNTGASFNDAFYKQIKPTDTQNALMNETDPNKRIQMLEQQRTEIDNIASQYQTGKDFNPMVSPAENNKKILGDKGFFF